MRLYINVSKQQILTHWFYNYCSIFRILVYFMCLFILEYKTLESPLNCKEIQPVHPKGDQSWVFIGKCDAEAETSILWPLHVNS